MQSSKIANRARWTRSLRVSLGGVGGKLRSIDGMRCVRCDQCQFGVTSVDSAVTVAPACKATGFMTNGECIAEAVNRHCFGHDHIQLLGGRAKSCEKNHTQLVARYCVLRDRACEPRVAARHMVGRDRQLTITAVEARRIREELKTKQLCR